MSLAILLPPSVALVLGVLGPRFGRRLRPPSAVRLLTVAALATSLTAGFVLAVAGFMALAQVPAVAAIGRWSITVLGSREPIDVALGGVGGLVALVLLVAAVRHAVRVAVALVRAVVVCRAYGSMPGDLIVVDSPAPDAFALPGLPGRVVVSTSMLRALPADERRSLLAHEAAHLHHHHHVYVELADLAAAANPLLRPVARAVRAGVERWADEVAADVVGDRRVAARALARAGLVRAGRDGARAIPAAALPAAHDGVGDRVRAMLDEPPRASRGLALGLVLLVVVTVGAAVHTVNSSENRFDRAEAAYESTVPSASHPRTPVSAHGER